tara:strand:- start:46181 stop:48001 length:1821 start_codon:yes stop_codon:yes gene_type:complete
MIRKRGVKLCFYVIIAFFSLAGEVSIYAQEVLPVWPNGVPNSLLNKEYNEVLTYDEANEIRGVSKVTNPSLTVYLAEGNKSNGAAVVICPGGGYSHLAINKEGYKVAKWFNSIGVSAFVLKYRLPNDLIMNDKSVGPLQDAQEAIRLVRRNAVQWKINPNKIGIIGFSAGGHLASTLSTHYNEKVYDSGPLSARPDFSILIYPVISMEDGVTHHGSKRNLLGEKVRADLVDKFSNEKQIDANTPPTFLIHAVDDKAVPVENSINYLLRLKENNVPAELHIYEKGGHGFGLGREGTSTYWPESLKIWLSANDFILDESVLLFSYFKGNGEDGLHLAYSNDGYKWKALKNDTSFLTPEVGKDSLMRDPCIIKGGDGNYHMVWTVSWTDKGIGYASSKDLINWSKQKFIPVMKHEKGTRNTWAPEITYDEDTKVYMIYWASTISGHYPETQSKEENGYNHRMYYTTTQDFKSFGKTQLLYEPGFNVIDAHILKHDNKYVMFLKDETKEPAEKNIKIAYSDNLTGPYSKASEPITGDYWAEGPTAIQVDGQWMVYFDKYMDGKYGAVRSKDLKNWNDVSDKIDFPKGSRHGSVFRISLDEFKAIQKKLGE